MGDVTPLRKLAMTLGARLGIRSRLLLLVLALGLPFLIYLFWSAVKQADEEREHARQQMLAIAQLTAARLDDHVGNMQHTLSTLAHAAGSQGKDTVRNDNLLRSLQPELPEHINNVTVWTRAGENIGTLEPELRDQPHSARDRRYFQEALQGHGLVTEAPIVSRVTGEPVVMFALPLRDGGESAGVVAASTRLRSLQTLLDPQGKLPKDAVITVVDRQGTILSRSIGADKWIGRALPLAQASLTEHFQEGAGTDFIQDLDGVERISGFTATRAVPWLVYVGLPTRTALAPVNARLVESLMLGGVLFMIGLALAVWGAENISRSLRLLSEDAAELGKGVLGHRSHRVFGGAEIALLRDNLNRMASAIEERSAALQRSEQGLRQVTDNLPALVAYLDREQRFRFANRAYHDWLGVEPETLIGRTVTDLYGAENYERMRSHIEAALAGDEVDYLRDMTTPRGLRHFHTRLVPDRVEGRVQGVYAMTSDITERREAGLLLARSEERLNLALEGSGLSLFDWDLVKGLIYYSAQASVFRGGPAVEKVMTPAEAQALVHPDDLPVVIERLRDAVKRTSRLYHVEYRVQTVSGDWIWLRSRGRVVERDANGRALRLAGTDAEITQRKHNEERLRHLAEFDNLTGLPNRALFLDRLQQALVRAGRRRQPIALLFLDIDHFKGVNDSLGHEAGDQLLAAFAKCIAGSLRKSDTVARLAGDEFTVILEDLHDAADACAMADKLVQAARRPVQVGDNVLHITTSIGMTLSLEGETDGATVLRRADAALYEAKHRGRDRYWYDAGNLDSAGAPPDAS